MSQLRKYEERGWEDLSSTVDLQRVCEGQCLDYNVEIARMSAHHCQLNVLTTSGCQE
jgi:hypothetical protein